MLNYRHLYYFWVVTKEGGFARAAERLDMAVQTRDRRFSDPKASIAALFAPRQTRIASENLAEANSPMQNYHDASRDKPYPLSLSRLPGNALVELISPCT